MRILIKKLDKYLNGIDLTCSGCQYCNRNNWQYLKSVLKQTV